MTSAIPQPLGALSSRKPLSLSSVDRTQWSPPQCVVSWTASIARVARRGLLLDAAFAFSGMLSAGVQPNHVTLVTLLSACADFPSSSYALPLGRALHAHALKCRPVPSRCGGVHDPLVLATALVDLYAKCGRADLARGVFERMPVKNLVSCNTMIAGYMRNGDVDQAISMFNEMPNRDRVSWTAVIDGCVKNGLLDEALEHFREMQLFKIDPDYVTLIAVIAVCADLGALAQGLWVHRYAMRRDFRNNVRLGNSLIDLYSRCGRVDFAHQLFERMPKRTLVSWNSMIVGFASNGCCREALEHFDMMRRAGFEPDGVSFTGVLTACSHAGLVDEGFMYYDLMRKDYEIPVRVEHYGCVVDLLGRAGRLEEAMHVVEGMPMRPNDVVLGSLLAACRMHGDVWLAERLMGYLVELEPECDSNYVLLSNMYAAIGRWEGVGEVRNKMKAIGIKKRPGFSQVEVNCDVHEFVAGDRSHPQSDDIYQMLNLLGLQMKLNGYDPQATMDIPWACE
ncbi:pentatricopeptide repeat-containing protein At1g05750, chloroplastic [Phoenix dactylifera]|uniref:Pentatricopeptide repeat-containing protein At1g05750, chloroplastic n=1 Tax=Phoenix dactylifera TaxID=42345 RepID=A0A8B7CJ58_PHODC|nr:pentatricopeptide repeat-containing protein At1g05750, chloroplastic [Phoenix dactylifera]